VFAGVLWMIFAMSCIGIVDALAKYLGLRLAGVEVAWGYFLSMWLCLIAWTTVFGPRGRALLRSSRPWLQCFRAFCLVMSLSLLFSALRVLPLAEATVISFTAPLFVVAMAGPLLKETVGWRRWVAVLVGLSGAAIAVQPGSSVFVWAAVLPLIGATFFATFQVVTRMVSDGPVTTVFYTSGVGALLLSIAVPFVWITPSAQEILLFLLSGGFGLAAHLAIVRSMMHTDASVVAPLNYVRLVWAVTIGVVVFGDWPGPAEWIGGTLIVGSGLYVLYTAARAPR